ncbi:hypothetical protein C6988_03170 [Nitrosopumilus sp. b1]|uniref:hypothetical protein n=1 Tax=Nitrosopumilus sp. b1 TaxID=2109907 RepID=UPI0015F61331|nr:hypothetical protein [Nitrosopumilus sp. b1]KAF6243454.1 hypothetical protein C6988_03170 [Nitrosopumilus sp. b1]
MIKGAARTVMFAFIAVGIVLAGFSTWALNGTDIPQEQFQEDPRFKEEYTKYHEWLRIFGMALIVIGGIIFVLGRKM